MVIRHNKDGGADSNERAADEVVVPPELTEEAEERIFAKIRASIRETDEEIEDAGKGASDGSRG